MQNRLESIWPRNRQDVSDPAVRRGLQPGGRYGTLERMNDGLVPTANAWPAGWPAGRSFVFEQADLVVSTLTVQCKVRAPAWAWLDQAACEVNQVWNFCNATSFKAAHVAMAGESGGCRGLT